MSAGWDYFMGNQGVPFKNLKVFVEKFSAGVRARAHQLAARTGRPLLYVASAQANKENLARAVMEQDGVQEGLICVLSCVEPCQTFTIRRDRKSQQWQLVPHASKCLHFTFITWIGTSG